MQPPRSEKDCQMSLLQRASAVIVLTMTSTIVLAIPYATLQ
jgi:hypothetical protein